MHFGKVAVRTRRRMAGFRAFVWLSWWLLCMSCMAHKLVRMWALNVLILFQSYETLKCRVNIEKWTQINALQIIRRQSGFVLFFRRCSIPTLVFLFLFSSVSPVVPVRSRLCGTLFHNPSRWMAFYQFMLLLFSNAFLLCFCFFFFLFVKWCFTDVVLDWHWKRIRIAQMTMVSAHNELYSSNCSAIVVNKYILFSHNKKKHHINLDGITMRACYYVWSIETTIERERERKRAYIFRLPFDDCGSL